MDKDVRKEIKKAFYNYKALSKKAVQSTVDWAEKNVAVDYSRVKVQSSSSNGKETQLCALIDDSLNAYRWCLVVEKVLEYYKWDCHEQIIRQRFFEKKGITRICIDVGISRSTFFYWVDEIFERAYKWAIEYKLLSPKDKSF